MHLETQNIDSASSKELARVSVIYSSYRLIRNLNFNFALTTAYFAAHGVAFSWFIALDGLYFVAKLLSESPNGYLADKYGRRALTAVGCITFTFALWTAAFFPSVFGFVVSQIVTGYAQGIQRPIPAAHLYEWLEHRHSKEKFSVFEGRGQSATNFAQAISTAIGGLMANAFGMTFVWIVTGAMGLLALLPVCLLPKTPSAKQSRPKPMLSQLGETFTAIAMQPPLRKVAVVYGVLFAATRLSFWLIQACLAAHDLDLWSFGLASLATYVIAALSSVISKPMAKNSKYVLWLQLLFYVLVPMAFFMETNVAIFIITLMVLILGYIYGIFQPIIMTWANDLVISGNRATYLSSLSSVASVFYIFVSIIMAGLLWFLPISIVSGIVVIPMICVGFFVTKKGERSDEVASR